MSSSTDGFVAVMRRARGAVADLLQARLEALVVGPEQPLRDGVGRAVQERPADGQEQQGPDAGTVALRLLGVGREVALERAADLRPVVAELAERLLDLVRQQGFGQRSGRPEDRALATAVDALAARRARRTRCRRRWRRPCPGCVGSWRARRPRCGRRPREPRAPPPARREPLGPGPGRHPFL